MLVKSWRAGRTLWSCVPADQGERAREGTGPPRRHHALDVITTQQKKKVTEKEKRKVVKVKKKKKCGIPQIISFLTGIDNLVSICDNLSHIRIDRGCAEAIVTHKFIHSISMHFCCHTLVPVVETDIWDMLKRKLLFYMWND